MYHTVVTLAVTVKNKSESQKTTDGPDVYCTEHMQRLLKDGTEHKDRKQKLAFYTGGKSDRVCDNEYDRDMQMKYRNNNDNQNESEVWKPTSECISQQGKGQRLTTFSNH